MGRLYHWYRAANFISLTKDNWDAIDISQLGSDYAVLVAYERHNINCQVRFENNNTGLYKPASVRCNYITNNNSITPLLCTAIEATPPIMMINKQHKDNNKQDDKHRPPTKDNNACNNLVHQQRMGTNHTDKTNNTGTNYLNHINCNNNESGADNTTVYNLMDLAKVSNSAYYASYKTGFDTGQAYALGYQDATTMVLPTTMTMQSLPVTTNQHAPTKTGVWLTTTNGKFVVM